MIGFVIAAVLGAFGKWRWLGYVALADMLVFGTSGLLRGDSEFALMLVLVASPLATGLGYGAGALWHRWRRGGWPHDEAIARLVTMRRGFDGDGAEVLYWEIETAVLTAQVARVFGVVTLLLFGFLTLVFGVLRDGAFVESAQMAAIGCSVVIVLFAVVIFGVLFNRVRRTYLLAGDFYTVALSDPRLFAGAFAAGAAGVASTRPVPIAAALSATALRGERHSWDAVAQACYRPEANRIDIRLKRLGWFGHDTIRCHSDGYAAASAWVARHIGHANDPAGCGGGTVKVTV